MVVFQCFDVLGFMAACQYQSSDIFVNVKSTRTNDICRIRKTKTTKVNFGKL